MIVVLAGGVGAARLLRGMVEATDPSAIVVVGNVGDDLVLHGLHVSPDLDTVTYTLADANDADRGWGLAGETWQAMQTLARLGPGMEWFSLGDRDLGTHLYRTHRIAEGAALSEVTAELAAAWGLSCTLVPVTDDPLRTRVTLGPGSREGEEISFQEYFVGLRHEVPVAAVRFEGAEAARPAPGVLEAIAGAARIVIAPSNPLVSIAPLLAVPGVREAVAARRDDVVAVSPLVAGVAIKGPADRLLAETGHEPSTVGIARLYARLAGTLVLDDADATAASRVAAEGLEPVVTDTVMTDVAAATALAQVVLAA